MFTSGKRTNFGQPLDNENPILAELRLDLRSTRDPDGAVDNQLAALVWGEWQAAPPEARAHAKRVLLKLEAIAGAAPVG